MAIVCCRISYKPLISSIDFIFISRGEFQIHIDNESKKKTKKLEEFQLHIDSKSQKNTHTHKKDWENDPLMLT